MECMIRIVEHIIQTSRENGFCSLKLKSKGFFSQPKITVSNLATVNIGTVLRLLEILPRFIEDCAGSGWLETKKPSNYSWSTNEERLVALF